MKREMFVTLVLTGLIFISFLASVSATSIINLINPSGNVITTNQTINISYGINDNGEGIKNMTFSYNGTNTTLYDNSLVLFYNFDNRSALGENDTFVRDLSGRWNNGTVVSATFNATNGIHGGDYQFDGNNDYINISQTINSPTIENTNFSVSAWIYPINNTNGKTFIAHARNSPGEYDFMLGTYSTSLDIQIWNSSDSSSRCVYWNSCTTTGVISLNSWNFVTIVFDITNHVSRLYKNGVNVGNLTWMGNMQNKSTYFTIGDTDPNFQNWNGSIDDVMIFNRTLSQSEVNQLYNSQITKYNQTYWQYNTTQTTSGYSQSYYLCAANSTGSPYCSASNSVTRVSNLTANFTNSIENVRSDFYGTNTHGSYLSDAESWNQQMFLNSNINFIRADMWFNYFSSSEGVYDTARLTKYTNLVTWARLNNKKILWVAGYMPSWLADTSKAYCSGDTSTCPPSNYTKWGTLVTTFLNNIGCDAGTCSVEVWNEPDWTGFWLSDVTDRSNVNRSVEYNKLYNATYLAVKSAYPTMEVGGMAGMQQNSYLALMISNWMSNFSDQIDFVSIHDYLGMSDFTDYHSAVANDYSLIYANITYYNVNTSRILLDEYNVKDSYIVNSSSNQWAMQLGLAYESTLNSYPKNVSLLGYQFADSTDLSGLPNNYEMLDVINNQTFISYNVTSNFAHLCSAGSTVYTSSTTDSTIKLVTCKNGNVYNIIVINTDTNSKNVTLNGLPSVINNLRNYSGNNFYPVNSNTANLGIMNSYDIDYLTLDLTPTTYYVNSTTGSDSNNGLSPSFPWKTIAKVNSWTFSPGDQILFERGQIWREQLVVPSSGNSTAQITFGAYGTGGKPIISGADALSGFVQSTIDVESGGIFVADAEDNGLADWTGSVTGGTATVTASTTSKDFGSYGYEFTSDATTDVYTYKNITASGDVYIRAYVKFKSGFDFTGTFKQTKIIRLLSGTTERGYIQIKKAADNTSWWLRFYEISPAGNSNEYQVQLDTWYRIELHYKVSSTVGGWEFKVDGNSPGGDSLNKNTSGQEIDTIQTGFVKGAIQLPTSTSAMYIDNVKADTSWIGTWAPDNPITWEKGGITTEPKTVIYNGIMLTPVNACLKTCALNTWDWDANTLYVNVGGDPGNGIEAGQRNYAISNTAKNYIIYNNLTLEGSNSGGIIIDSGNYNILNGLTIKKVGNGNAYGIFLADDSYAAGHGNHIVKNNTLEDIYGDGIFTQRVRNITIDSNNISAVYAGPGGNSGDNVQLLDSTNITISKNFLTQLGSNTVKGNIVAESFNGISSGFVVEDNELAYGNFGLGFYQADGIIIRNNRIYNQTTYSGIQGIDDNTTDAQIYGNIIYNINGNGINLCGSWNRTNIKIYNNIILGVTGQYGICLEQFDGEIKNNIIWNSGSVSNYAYFVTLKSGGTINSDYNIIGPESVTRYISFTGGDYSTLAAYVSAKAQDSNSLNANPLFIDAANRDFSLNSTSPAIDAGINVGLTTDYLGNAVLGTPDLGAYEYQPPYNISQDAINTSISGGIRIYGDGKYRHMNYTAGNYNADLKVVPASGFDTSNHSSLIDLNITEWNSTTMNWTEYSDTLGETNTTHTLCSLAVGQYYDIYYTKAGSRTLIARYQVDHFGCIEFDYTGGYSSVTFDAELYTPTNNPNTGSPGGGPSGPSTTSWTTYNVSDGDFAAGYTKELAKSQRLQFNVGTESHYIGVQGISGNNATIQVSSTPITMTMSVGQEAKLDLTNDTFYELYVKLLGVNNSKANLTIEKIHEQIPGITGEVTENQTANETAGNQTGITGATGDTGSRLLLFWAIVAVIVIALLFVIGTILKRWNRTRRKNRINF